jgi:hypothetical protein
VPDFPNEPRTMNPMPSINDLLLPGPFQYTILHKQTTYISDNSLSVFVRC